MAYLPMDIIDDLFRRLPATTLVRFRVLSKPCFSLIDSPDFVASHLKRNVETGDHLMILLRDRGRRFLRTVYLDAPGKVSDVEHPLQASGFTDVFGSCNGLIGLTNSPVDLALFNPSTRKIHRLPIEPVDFPERLVEPEYVLYGLGYDSDDDYKVARMIQCKKAKGEKVSYEIKVFSLKRNSWKRIGLRFEVQKKFFKFYYHVLYRRGHGVQVGNSLHWILPRRHGVIARNTIIRFDLASEDFEFVGYPQDLCYEDFMDLCALDGCLCVMGYYGFTHVDVWMKREYEGEGSWSKLFRVTKPESVESLDFMRPLLHSKDKSKVLLEINIGKLVWFDLASKSFQTLGVTGCEDSCGAYILVSSLVLGCNGDPRRARENKMMHKSSKRWDGFLSKGFKLKL